MKVIVISLDKLLFRLVWTYITVQMRTLHRMNQRIALELLCFYLWRSTTPKHIKGDWLSALPISVEREGLDYWRLQHKVFNAEVWTGSSSGRDFKAQSIFGRVADFRRTSEQSVRRILWVVLNVEPGLEFCLFDAFVLVCLLQTVSKKSTNVAGLNLYFLNWCSAFFLNLKQWGEICHAMSLGVMR